MYGSKDLMWRVAEEIFWEVNGAYDHIGGNLEYGAANSGCKYTFYSYI
jgi:hypothetical protein